MLFRSRLSEFVSNAGNALYKGISEILDRTMTERRDRGVAVADVKASTASQIEAVRTASAALRQLREGIWVPEDLATN